MAVVQTRAPFNGGVSIGHVFTIKTMKTQCYDYHGPFAIADGDTPPDMLSRIPAV